MKHSRVMVAAAALMVSGMAVWAETQDPFADIVETRHGLMMQMAADVAKMGAMVKGEAPYDAAVAGKAAANVAAVASVISMDQFPAGSENGKAADSFAKAEIWANQTDFLAKLADLNTAAATLKDGAGKDADTLKTDMMALGKACGACHTAYRQSEG